MDWPTRGHRYFHKPRGYWVNIKGTCYDGLTNTLDKHFHKPQGYCRVYIKGARYDGLANKGTNTFTNHGVTGFILKGPVMMDWPTRRQILSQTTKVTGFILKGARYDGLVNKWTNTFTKHKVTAGFILKGPVMMDWPTRGQILSLTTRLLGSY